jgi:glycolate oxidase FAD binding subunit
MTEFFPNSPEAVAAALAGANAAGRTVEVCGNRTKTRWGGPVASADTRLSTRELKQVIEYEPRDLTISVGAGMPYAELTRLLDANRQMVPIEPPYAAGATIGGILAANHSGPRRRLYGTARDLVIGVEFATLEGKLIRAGGMVVKNVAGLDMGKLLIGSWGTLAVLTKVNFKLIPRERATRSFLYVFDSAAEAAAKRSAILQSPVQPSAVDILNPAAASRLGRQGWILALATGGSPAVIERYTREFPGAETLDGDAESGFWEGIREFSPRFLEEHPEGAVVKARTTLEGLAALLEAHAEPAVARAGTGITYLHFSAPPPSLPANAVIEAGPASREKLTLWPDAGDAFATMEKIKGMLDPKRLLNRGRLYGRI